MSGQFTLADIQMSYMLAIASSAGLLTEYPAVEAYLERLEQQPGLPRAVESGGPMPPEP